MSKLKMFRMMTAAMMMAMGSDTRQVRETIELTQEEKDEKQEEIKICKGLKKFYMGNDIVVWALNEKNAIRKFKKMKP